MKILGLVDSIDHVCCRYRLRAFSPGLAQVGHELELRSLGRGFTRWRTLGRVNEADIVILQRKLLAPWELSRLRRHAKRLIFDFDDAVFLRDSYHPRGQLSDKRRRRFAATIAAADVVIAGNDWLADHASDARNVVVIPTCVDADSYRPAAHIGSNLICVWIGSSSTLNGLETHRQLLEQVGHAVPGLTLRLVCDRAISLRNWKVEHWPWSSESESEAIASADVGISLLPDDDWSRGKCGLKVLQYLAAGLPVVGNPVGVTEAMVGPAGLMVESADQWISALQKLRDVPTRRAMGTMGRKRIEEHFSIQYGLRLWQNLLKNLASTRRAG